MTDLPEGPFYGFNRPGSQTDSGCHRQLVAPRNDGRGAKAHYDGIVAFSQTDFTEDFEEDHGPGARDARR